VHEVAGIPQHSEGPRTRVDMGSTERVQVGGSDAMLSKAHEDVQQAIAAAQQSSAAAPVAAAPDAAPDAPPPVDDAPDPETPTTG
jgi:hypothetical protein